MEFPLTNITNPTLQHMNRSEGSFEGDVCSSMSGAGSSSPVYGPTVNTQHEQFVNVGPVDPNGGGQRKNNQGQRKNQGYNPNGNPNNGGRKNSDYNQRRGISPTNSQPYSSGSRPQYPIGGGHHHGGGMMGEMDPMMLMMMQQQAALQQQQQSSNQASPSSLGGGAMSEDELEHQRLEEFAALQQQLQMMQYSNDHMMTYFHQMGMQVPLHMLQAGGGGGSPMMQHNHMGRQQYGGLHHSDSQSGSPMNSGGFTMPSADRMAAMDYHQMVLQQQHGGDMMVVNQHQDMMMPEPTETAEPEQQQYRRPQQRPVLFQTPNKAPRSSAGVTPTATPKAFGMATPETTISMTKHKVNSTAEDPCPCMHCHQAKAMGTPSDNNTLSQGASPEEFTPLPNHHHHHQSGGGYGSKGQGYNTPHRSTERSGSNRYSNERPHRGGNDRSFNKQQQQPQQERRGGGGGHNHHQNSNPVSMELFSMPPQALPRFKVQIAGHFGRKFHVRSALSVKKGDFVIFDGDRGVELGEVAEINPLDAKEMKKAENQQPPSANQTRRGFELLHRQATEDEVHRWKTLLMEDAAEATKSAQALATEHGLRLIIRCGSYQFDGKKLTFFYEAEHRVDFRKMLSEMFSRFHCRIWMEQTSELAFVPQ